MEQVIVKNTQDPEKSKFLYGNEKMNEEQNKNKGSIEITKTKNGLRPTRQPFPQIRLTFFFCKSSPFLSVTVSTPASINSLSSLRFVGVLL
jgi:hypothetical protein